MAKQAWLPLWPSDGIAASTSLIKNHDFFLWHFGRLTLTSLRHLVCRSPRHAKYKCILYSAVQTKSQF